MKRLFSRAPMVAALGLGITGAVVVALLLVSPDELRPLSEAQGKALVEAAWVAVHDGKEPPPLGAVFAGWSPALVFVSASDGDTTAVVAKGAGKTMDEALAQALSSWKTAEKRPARPPIWVKVHAATGEGHAQEISDRRGVAFDPSLYALSFPEIGVTLLPEQTLTLDVVQTVDQQRLIDLKEFERVLGPSSARSKDFKKWQKKRTRTVVQIPVSAWYKDEAAGAIPIYRGHRLPPDPVDATALEGAVRLAAGYLAGAVAEDGSFAYNFQPKRGKSDGDYNILRHAGTTYAMLEIDQAFGMPDLRAKAEKALAFLGKRIEPCVSPDKAALCVVEEGATKLGGNGLALVALAKHAEVTGDRAGLPVMRGLARRIVSIQDPGTGELTQHKQKHPEGTPVSFVSDYYPGEAILGLMRLYALDPDPLWLETATKAAHWLIDVRDAGKPTAQLDHDHWFLYGLNELYRAKKAPSFLMHAKKIVQAIVGDQNGPVASAPDWRGGWYEEPRGTPAATRAEGLMAAYRLFTLGGDKADAATALAAAKEAARFQLATQLREERVMYFPEPRRALGGFGESLTGYEVRIDYVQHNVSALLALRAALGG